MLTLPFLQKNTAESQRYIFILFFSGERLYGFAFEEANSNNQSSLYQEPVDPHLKNAADKIEKIIANCEHDLGENVYLKKTVLVLNSLYTTESGTIRDDFLNEIKKILKSVDLDNLGYLNLYEVIVHNFQEKKKFIYLEESLYDYSLYSIAEGQIKKINKVVKAPDFNDTAKDLKKYLDDELEIIGWINKDLQKEEIKIKDQIGEEKLKPFFINVYFKDKQDSKNNDNENVVVEFEKQELPLAPGFTDKSSIEEEPVSETLDFHQDQSFVSDSKFKFKLPKINWHFQRPNFSKRIVLIIFPIVLTFLVLFYFFFFHQAVISLETKKENFSSNIDFEVASNISFVKTYQTEVSLTASETTTGEKVTGERARGEVTIYNGMFEKKDLAAGFRFVSSNGVEFMINESVSVPAATTSANIDEGLITTAYGKKNVEVTAVNIGAEGNLDSGVKLTTDEFESNDFYALTITNFGGGVKRTVAVFANKDAETLDKKALTMSKNRLLNEFKQNHSESDILFTDTISTTGVKKNYSAEINDEVNRVTLTYQGQVKAFYVPYEKLMVMVQKQKLKDKEFVENSFSLAKIKLVDKTDNEFQYSAIVKGQVQNFIDRQILLEKIRGKLLFNANRIIKQQPNIINHKIQIKPIPLPILPFRNQAIQFEFAL